MIAGIDMTVYMVNYMSFLDRPQWNPHDEPHPNATYLLYIIYCLQMCSHHHHDHVV